jgi:hypothetical protein
MRFARGFVGTHYLGVAGTASHLRRLVECYDVHVKRVVPEIHTVRSGGRKSGSAHRYITIYAVPAANLFMLRAEWVHCQLSHL